MECLASLLLLNYKLVHLQSQLIFSILCVADLMYMHQKKNQHRELLSSPSFSRFHKPQEGVQAIQCSFF